MKLRRKLEFFEQDYSGLKYYRPGQLEALKALVTKQSLDTFWQESSWNVSDPSFRQLALMYYGQDEHPSQKQKKSLNLGKTLVIRGDLSIEHSLEIRGRGSLVVLGNLEVGGSIYVASDYPSLYVAGELRAENLYASQAEIIVLHGIKVQSIFALKYNHTVVITPSTETAVCAIQDAFPDTEITSDREFSKLDAEFFKATIDPSFEDTHKSEEQYYEMLDEIDARLHAFFCTSPS